MRGTTLADWAEHMLKFHDGRFGMHSRFRFLVFNIIMRQRGRDRTGFFVKQHPELNILDIDDLKEKLAEDPALLRNIVRSGAPLTGTRPYWRQKGNNLGATVRHFAHTGAIFCTWSCADHQWADLHRHLPRYDEWKSGTEDERRKIAWENVQRSPHVIAAWLDLRFKAFLDMVMRPFLKIDDYWYWYEWQARGTGHIHCIIWMKSAPKMCTKTAQDRERFAQYWNDKVTAVNPDLLRQPDARNPASLPFIHIFNTNDQLSAFMNRLQQHATCMPGYCLRMNKATKVVECRFFFPRELQEYALVTKNVNKKSWMFGAPRNQDRLNQCIPVIPIGWMANSDAQPAATYGGLANYVGKYVSKAEKKSDTYQEIQAQVGGLLLSTLTLFCALL